MLEDGNVTGTSMARTLAGNGKADRDRIDPLVRATFAPRAAALGIVQQGRLEGGCSVVQPVIARK